MSKRFTFFHHEIVADQLLPGEWCYWRWGANQPYKLTAVCACPMCGKCGTLSPDIHTVNPNGLVSPSYVCPFQPCMFHEFVQLGDWHGSHDPAMKS